MTKRTGNRVRRITIYLDRKKQFRFRCQAGNWAVVGGGTEQGFAQKRTVMDRVRALQRENPGVEVVDET